MDRTHIRWFTKTTVAELFRDSGFEIVEGGGRVISFPDTDRALVGIRALADAIGADADEAAENAIPFQWLVRAIPAKSA
jgi:hypothetical protein